MKRICLLLVLLTALLSQAAQAQTGQTITGTITVGGLVRDYRLYVPAAYVAGRPTPLLLNLHGYSSNNQQQELYGDFRAIADTAKFLIVHPNGTIDGNGNRYWNTFTTPNSGGPDDLAFLSALIDAIGQQYTLDPDRLYCTGLSNGGFMSYELACHLGNRIAAVASVAGSIATTRLSTCMPAHPTPVLEIHGDADGTVPYPGNVLFTPVPDVLSYWVTANACNPTPTVVAVPDTDPTDGCTAVHSTWRGNRTGAVVEHFRIVGGGHTWPGAPVTIGVTNRDINASVEIWRFLRRYRFSRLALATAAPAVAPLPLSVYPNPATGAATVLISGAANLQPAQLHVFDALGRAVRAVATPAAGGTVQLDVSSWPDGIYFLQMVGPAASWIKLVK